MLKVGDWVTQYSVGFWQVVAVYPKFAENDYTGEKFSWRKGDRLGDWVVLKKGLTPKMKFSNACEFVDSQWCKPITDEQRLTIEAAFRDNPKAQQKFDEATFIPKPMVASVLLDLPEDRVEEYQKLLTSLPERFTDVLFREHTHAFKQYEKMPPAGYILYLFSYPWEMDEHFNILYHEPQLKKIT